MADIGRLETKKIHFHSHFLGSGWVLKGVSSGVQIMVSESMSTLIASFQEFPELDPTFHVQNWEIQAKKPKRDPGYEAFRASCSYWFLFGTPYIEIQNPAKIE